MTVYMPMDAARAFDELAILSLKAAHGAGWRQFDDWSDCLLSELGMDTVLFSTIVASPEYQRLFDLNRQAFDSINRLAKEGPWEGGLEEINGPKGLNHQRYLAKKALQERFFPNAPLMEKKVGYVK